MYLFKMMLSSGVPQLQRLSDIEYLRESLSLDLDDEQAKLKISRLITESLNTKRVALNNFVHMVVNNPAT